VGQAPAGSGDEASSAPQARATRGDCWSRHGCRSSQRSGRLARPGARAARL